MQRFKYQSEGVDFLTGVKHGLLCDDMGLGKSRVTIDTTMALECDPVLIICPNSLKYNWAQEIEKWAPGNSCVIVGGGRYDKFEDREKQIKSGARFVIINYDLVGTITHQIKDGEKVDKQVDDRHRTSLCKIKWKAVIIDEAHKIRNRKSKAYNGIKKILSAADPGVVIPLTGTPLYTKVDNIWPLLHFVDKKKFSSFYTWAETHCKMSYNPFSPYPKVEKINDIEAFKAEIAPIMLRRLKDDALPDMPKKMFINIDVDLKDKQRVAYDKISKDLYLILRQGASGELLITNEDEFDSSDLEVNALNTVSLMMRQKQIAVSLDLIDPTSTAITGAKIDALMDILDGAGDQKVIITSQFARAISRLNPYIQQKLGLKGLWFTGKTKTADRQIIVDDFQNNDKIKYIMFTSQTGGEGITLTAGSIMVTLDLLWAPAANGQVVARMDRIGQTKPMTVYVLNARDTVEDKIIKVLNDREALFNSITPVTRIMSIAKTYIREGTT